MTPDSTPSAVISQRATAREFFAVVFRRRWIILGLFTVTLATALTVALTTPVFYISSGQVLVRRGEQQTVMSPSRQVTNDWEIELGNELQTVRSWPVLQRAQQILDEENRGRRAKPLDERQVNVEVTGKSNVLAIAYRDRDPGTAERDCDALLRAYISYRQGSQLTYPQRFFDTEISQAAAELRRTAEARRQFTNQAGVVDLTEQGRTLITERGLLERQRTEIAADLAEATSQYNLMLQLRERPEIDMPTMLQPSVNENTLDEIKRRVVEQQGRIAQLRERYREGSPEVVAAGVTLDTLRAILQREVDSRIAVSRSRLEVLKARLVPVESGISRLDAQLQVMPDQEARLAQMDQEVTSWKSRFNDLIKNSDQARVTENTVPLISVFLLNPASRARPQNARDYVRLGLAPAFSLVVGLGLAFFVDGLDLTVHTSGQAEEEVQVRVLAAITERKRRGRRSEPRDPEQAPG